jgi:DNA polymerase
MSLANFRAKHGLRTQPERTETPSYMLQENALPSHAPDAVRPGPDVIRLQQVQQQQPLQSQILKMKNTTTTTTTTILSFSGEPELESGAHGPASIFKSGPPAAAALAAVDAITAFPTMHPLHGSGTAFHWDVETRSAAELATRGKKRGVGAPAYAEHETTSVLCVCFAWGDGPVESWEPGEPVPAIALAAAADPTCCWVAHNAAFERVILRSILGHGWPEVPLVRQVCSMSLALSHAYPGSLEAAAEALGLVNRKDVARAKRVKKMWKPRPARRDEDPTQLYWHDTPELRAENKAYCKQDVATERELHQRLCAIPASEHDAAVLDAEINDRGVRIDAPLAAKVSRLAAQALAEMGAEICALTEGAVDRTSKPATIKTWLKQQGVELPRRPKKKKSGLVWETCLEAGDIEKLLEGELPDARARRVLEIRLQAAQSAASKIDRMLLTRSADGRVRGLFRFYGSMTGRWSGAGFQPQNLKRPELIRSDAAVAEAIEAVQTLDYAAVKARYRDVLGLAGDLCRSMIIPAEGHRFIVGDFSSVEARVLAWLAGAEEEVEAFRQFDRGIGPDAYVFTAQQVFGPDGVGDPSRIRQLGKIFKLGLGYGMGPNRLLSEIRKARIPGTENLSISDVRKWVRTWREINFVVVGYWYALDAAAVAAVRNPGMLVPCRAVSFEMRDRVLLLHLPSGRPLSYPAPVLEPGRDGEEQIAFRDMEAGRRRDKHMYGGKWAENVTQAVARDLLVDAMKRLRAADYRLVMHAHDEAVAEMPIGEGSAEEFKRLLIGVPSWAEQLPVAAKVFECDRFKKD